MGLSGGVDSAVAAAELQSAGWRVVGLFLRMAEASQPGGGCMSAGHAQDAAEVAERLGIELVTRPAGDALADVQEDFVRQYTAGRTPNPCILCNARVKLATLAAEADRLGLARIATGHHARIVAERSGRARLARARGRQKDQSYALFAVPAGLRERLVLPLGELPGKEEVRRRARALDLPVHDKPDSQDICFVPDDDYPAWLARRAPRALTPGPIVSVQGQTLGRHEGYGRYTIGQRRGLGIAAAEPLYVTAIDPATATVTVGTRNQVQGRWLQAVGGVWHVQPPAGPFEALVQIRYNHRGAAARVRPCPGGFQVRFHEPVHAITPGQAAVVYIEETVLGGGWIHSTGAHAPESDGAR